MPRLSVNINKIALLRNSRGGGLPDLITVAKDCERFGAEGITVHPRPDERHIRYRDVYELKEVLQTELNVEGYPSPKWMETVLEVRPAQCTLVPDSPGALTSDKGWDTVRHQTFLKDIITTLKKEGIRVSVFIDPAEQFAEGAAKAGAGRIELYTGPYAKNYSARKEEAVIPYLETARYASGLGLGINAGHDLNLENLAYLKQQLPVLDEVSIGHALIADALYYGLENAIRLYRRQLG